MQIINIYDEKYSFLLSKIIDPPEKLYCIGNIELLNEKCVSIVGSRNASPYGKGISKKLAYNLSKQGYVIVSGMAIGIDECAHLGSIMNNSKTIAVLGSGFNNIYPKSNINLFNRIISGGGLAITEYEPNVKPLGENFPMRNRIIAGLSMNTIVVEAGEKSGSLITSDLANEFGRNVYSVPGNINNISSAGTNKLIFEGATPIISIEKFTL